MITAESRQDLAALIKVRRELDAATCSLVHQWARESAFALN